MKLSNVLVLLSAVFVADAKNDRFYDRIEFDDERNLRRRRSLKTMPNNPEAKEMEGRSGPHYDAENLYYPYNRDMDNSRQYERDYYSEKYRKQLLDHGLMLQPDPNEAAVHETASKLAKHAKKTLKYAKILAGDTKPAHFYYQPYRKPGYYRGYFGPQDGYRRPFGYYGYGPNGYPGFGQQAPYGYGGGAYGGYGGYYSDRRLKTDITQVGKSDSGIPIYTFKYRKGVDAGDGMMNSTSTFSGVIAQDLLELAPEAVAKDPDGAYYLVDYSKIDVEFRKIH